MFSNFCDPHLEFSKKFLTSPSVDPLPPPSCKIDHIFFSIFDISPSNTLPLWIRGRVVRASSLGSKGPEFDFSVRPPVVKIANHC